MDQGFEQQLKRNRNQRSMVEFPWNNCEYVATRACNLKIHFKGEHEVVRHPCPKCQRKKTENSYWK